MTWYFDDKGQKLLDIERAAQTNPEAAAWQEQLRSLEEEMVADVSICSACPGFPVDLAAEIDRLVLKHGVYSVPCNTNGPEIDTYDEYIRRIMSLAGDLHTVFHDVSQRNIRGFSDDPRMPLRVLCSKAEARREQMVEDSK